MKQQRLFTVVETAENNIDRTSLFAIVIMAGNLPWEPSLIKDGGINVYNRINCDTCKNFNLF